MPRQAERLKLACPSARCAEVRVLDGLKEQLGVMSLQAARELQVQSHTNPRSCSALYVSAHSKAQYILRNADVELYDLLGIIRFEHPSSAEGNAHHHCSYLAMVS